MRLAVVILLVGVVSAANAAPIKSRHKKELAKLQSFWKKALGHGLKLASGLFAKEQDDDVDTAEIEDLIAKLQDDDDDDNDNDNNDLNEKRFAKLQSFWKKALKHGLKLASGLFAKEQDDNDAAEIEDLLSEVQDAGGKKQSPTLQSFWKKALKHGLKYASGLFAKEQDDDGTDEIEDLIAKLQDDDVDEKEAKLSHFKSSGGHSTKSLAKKLLDKLSNLE